MATLIDSYSESNADTYIPLDTGDFLYCGQAWQAAQTIKVGSCKFHLKKTGSPTGNMYAYLFAATGTPGTNGTGTGTALATSNAIDVSTLGTSAALVEFTFATPYEVQNGNNYVICLGYSGGDTSNYVEYGCDVSSPTHAGNMAYKTPSGAWDYSTADGCFYAYGPNAPVLSAVQDGTHIDLSWS